MVPSEIVKPGVYKDAFPVVVLTENSARLETVPETLEGAMRCSLQSPLCGCECSLTYEECESCSEAVGNHTKICNRGPNLQPMRDHLDHYKHMCYDIVKNNTWYKPIDFAVVDGFMVDFYSLVYKAFDDG